MFAFAPAPDADKAETYRQLVDAATAEGSDDQAAFVPFDSASGEVGDGVKFKGLRIFHFVS